MKRRPLLQQCLSRKCVTMKNYAFNINEWLTRFPLIAEHARFSGQHITSPWHICQNEQLRGEMRDQFVWGPAVPVDLFIMADGEPADRHVTKIGGLPYRSGTPWPTMRDGEPPYGSATPRARMRDGEPLLFLAQFNFSDSKDLSGELPGDL